MAGLTLLITTHNRGPLLQRSLDRLCHLTPPDELLIVDDGGADETESVVEGFRDRLPVRYLYHDNPGPTICSFARNVGLRHATYEWLATTEPEVVFRSDVVAQFLQLKSEHPSEVISAGTIDFLSGGEAWPDSMVGELPTGRREVGWVATYAALYHRDWLFAVGGWDEGFPGPWGWDDTDLLTRLRLAGNGQHIAREVEVVHQYHGLGSDPNRANEAHFLGKSFHQDQDDHADVIANKGVEWGALR